MSFLRWVARKALYVLGFFLGDEFEFEFEFEFEGVLARPNLRVRFIYEGLGKKSRRHPRNRLGLYIFFCYTYKEQRLYSSKMIVMCARPPLKVQPKENNKRVQKLKKIWKIQKQMKKEEKALFRELWEARLRPVEYDLDFDDLFDTF